MDMYFNEADVLRKVFSTYIKGYRNSLVQRGTPRPFTNLQPAQPWIWLLFSWKRHQLLKKRHPWQRFLGITGSCRSTFRMTKYSNRVWPGLDIVRTLTLWQTRDRTRKLSPGNQAPPQPTLVTQATSLLEHYLNTDCFCPNSTCQRSELRNCAFIRLSEK